MKTVTMTLTVWFALAGMAHANEPSATQDRQAADDSLVLAEVCEAAGTPGNATPDRFARAAEVARRECEKPDWSWRD